MSLAAKVYLIVAAITNAGDAVWVILLRPPFSSYRGGGAFAISLAVGTLLLVWYIINPKSHVFKEPAGGEGE